VFYRDWEEKIDIPQKIHVSGLGANPIWYLTKDQGDLARVSPTHGTLFPHRMDSMRPSAVHIQPFQIL
jgi:hypothetical protein